MTGNVLGDNTSNPNFYVVPNRNITNDFASGSDYNMVSDFRRAIMSFAYRYLVVDATIPFKPCGNCGGSANLAPKFL